MYYEEKLIDGVLHWRGTPDGEWQPMSHCTEVGCPVMDLLDRLHALADNAYYNYIGLCRMDECIGWEAKVEKGFFGYAELKAHKDAAEQLGRHRALQEAESMLRELVVLRQAHAEAEES